MMVYDEKARAVFRSIVEGETKSGYDGELLKGCGVRWRWRGLCEQSRAREWGREGRKNEKLLGK